MNNAEVIRRNLEAYAAGNWDEYKSHLADNVKYDEFATRTSTTGKDKYLEHVKLWKRAFPDAKAKVLNEFSIGDTVVTELEWTGTQSGPMEGPLGRIQPTNRTGSLKAVLVSRLENGKVVETRHYFDILTVLAQLGVLAGVEGGQPRAAAETRPSTH